ncbi:MAG: hypothetical protein HWN66_05740 [Candidatus Helarchaeota archaeon]|nr:hypothetical protein [Candidatus Helarchaeota archaeon]
MERATLLKSGYELVIIINALSIILWIFLSIFPGFNDLWQGNILDGLQVIFLNFWCLSFLITLGVGIFLHKFLEDDQKVKEK